MTRHAWIVLLVGAALVFVGEKMLGSSALSSAGAALALLGVLASALRTRDSSAPAIERLRTLAQSGVLLAIVLYGASTDAGLDLLGAPVGHPFERVLRFAWPSVGLCALFVIVAVEMRLREVPQAQWGESTLSRARDAAFRAAAIAFATIFVAAINVAANARDASVDLSYLGVTEPSDPTHRMVRNLGEPVRALMLFSEGHEVFERVEPFFDALHDDNELFVPERIDHALIPGLATRLRLDGNGIVALIRGEGDDAQAEVIEVGLDLATARPALRTLDGRFQEAFSKLTQPRREVFFTVGHGERGLRGDEENEDERLEQFTRALRRFNFAPRQLGLAQGLARGISDDVPLVVVAGAREAFSPEEVASLANYVRQGGRLLVFADHDGGPELLAELGLEMLPGVVSASESFVPRTRTEADKQRVYTERFSQHPIVRTARARRRGHAVVLSRGAAFAPIEPAPEGVRVVFPVRTEDDSWRDLDDDLELDEDERAQPERVVAALDVGRGRAIVIGDGSFGGDDSFGYRGNNALLGDSLQWLIGDLREHVEPIVVGVTTTEEDTPLEHKHADDALFFHATSFGPPIPLLIVGIWVARRRRRRGRAQQ